MPLVALVSLLAGQHRPLSELGVLRCSSWHLLSRWIDPDHAPATFPRSFDLIRFDSVQSIPEPLWDTSTALVRLVAMVFDAHYVVKCKSCGRQRARSFGRTAVTGGRAVHPITQLDAPGRILRCMPKIPSSDCSAASSNRKL